MSTITHQHREHSVGDILSLLGPAVLNVYGSKHVTFSAPARLEVAGPGSISFCKLSGADARERIKASKAAVIICGPLGEAIGSATLIETSDPRKAFVKVVAGLFTPDKRTGVHPRAIVDASAQVHPSAYVGPGAVIGARCVVGAGTEIHANVVLYEGTTVGMNVTIYSGTVVGADGFGYERAEDGTMEKFVHLGGVVIEDDVEIGSNTSIDRGTLGDTLIRRGSKVDNQVHIAHNADLGEDCVVIAQSMVGGSVKIGARAWLAPSTVVMNGISIGADALCGLGAVVTKSVGSGETVMGNPARPLAEAKALLAAHKMLIAR